MQLYLIKEADNGFVAIQVLLDVKKRSRDKIDIDFFKNWADSKAISKQERQENLYLNLNKCIF